MKELHTKFLNIKEKIPNKDHSEVCNKLNTMFNQINNKLNTLEIDYKSNINYIEKNKKDKENILKNDICPFCKTIISKSLETQSHIQHIESDIKSLEEKNKKIKDVISIGKDKKIEIEQKLEKVKNVIEKIKTFKEMLVKIETLIDDMKIKIAEEEKKEFLLNDLFKLEDVELCKKELDNKNNEYKLLEEEINYNDIIKDILSDNGIKKYIMKKVLPILTKKTNEYLSLFKAKYSIIFNEDLEEKFKIRNKQDRTYGGFSAGEQKRIDLAFMFAMLDVSKAQSSIDSNILILDEIIDSSLCINGIFSLLQYLKTDFIKMYPNVCVYVITHKKEISEDNFNRVITVSKENEFTKIHEIKEINQVLQV